MALFGGGGGSSLGKVFATNGLSVMPELANQASGLFNRGGSFGSIGGFSNNLDIETFRSALKEYNPQLFSADYGGQQFQDLATRFGGLADQFERERLNVGQDPRFEQYRESQFNVFEEGADEQRRRASAELARRGLGGSSTSLNQLGAINQRLDTQRQALSGQIGLQEMNREDQLRQAATQNLFGALGSQQGALGAAGGAEEARLNAVSAGLENLLAIPSLQVSQQAVEVAGRLPEEEEPGLFGKIFGGLF